MMTPKEVENFKQLRNEYVFARKMCEALYGKIYDFVEKTDPGALDDIMFDIIDFTRKAIEADKDPEAFKEV